MTSQRNTAASTQDGPALEPGSTPTVPAAPDSGGAETTPVGVTVEAAVGYIQSIRDNYSQYRATGQIPWGNAVAFNAGDPVPADYPTLQQLVDDGLVEQVAKPAKSRGK